MYGINYWFVLQIEAADKQIRIFKKFVEEQATEREQERDEFLNEINRLVEALKVKERDSSLKERTNEEVRFFLFFVKGCFKNIKHVIALLIYIEH